MTRGLIRMWAPGWSSNGTHGMMHTHGNPKKFPPDLVTTFPARSAKEVVCHRDDNKSPEEGVCCTGIKSVNSATINIDSARCLIRLCLLGQPCQRDVGVRSTDNVNDWSLEHSFTIAWYMDVADSSYIAVCYDCLWLIDHSQVLISLFYDGIVRFLTEFKGLRRGHILNGTMSAGDGSLCM